MTAGKTTLDFLIKQSFINGVLVPTEQDGWYNQNGKRYHFDQQPEEAMSMVHALNAGSIVMGDGKYSILTYKAFYWFLGDNSLNQVVYDRTTGGCYDGISQKEINLSRGGEATISYLMARLALD